MNDEHIENELIDALYSEAHRHSRLTFRSFARDFLNSGDKSKQVLSTIVHAVECGEDPKLIFDENSPLMDQARAVLKALPIQRADALNIYVWFAENKGTERDGEQFIRAWTHDPVRVDGLRNAIGKEPTIYSAILQAATREAPSPTPRIFADNVHVHNSTVEITCANAVKAALLAEALIAASAPSADAVDESVPWWKVMELAEKHGKGWSQYSGWAFMNDDNLHAFAQAIAAIAPKGDGND